MKYQQWLLRSIRIICLVLALVSIQQLSIVQAADKVILPNFDQAEALAALNADRTKNGLKPLVYNDALSKLANDYAADMLKRGFFDHNNPEGQTPFDRMDAQGIDYRYAGENLAINDTIAAAEVAFMNSPSHRDNILNPNFTEVGIGIEYADNGKIYLVQEFIGTK